MLHIYMLSLLLTTATLKPIIVFFFQLEDTRTTDRKQTFLGYIVEVVQKKFPDLQDFSEELYLDGATTGELSISRQNVCQCIVVCARSF